MTDEAINVEATQEKNREILKQLAVEGIIPSARPMKRV